MAGYFKRIAAVTGLSLAAAACASTPSSILETGGVDARGVRVEIPTGPVECVPYARARSGIMIRGDAWTWWDQAAGRYVRAHTPRVGAVLVFSREGGPPGGHVAVVRALTSPREIRIDHADWLGRDLIYLGDPVLDVSPANDWSLVKVWNVSTGSWGKRDYPIAGFVGPNPASVTSGAP